MMVVDVVEKEVVGEGVPPAAEGVVDAVRELVGEAQSEPVSEG